MDNQILTSTNEHVPASLAPSASEDWLIGKCGTGKKDWIAAFLVALTAIFFFGKTVFQGLPISKISRLSEWDSLFSAYWTGSGGNCDPSLVQLMVPYYFLVAKFWQCGQLPFWNPYNAFGVPLLGDLQSAVFSPVHLLLNLAPSMRIYNLTIVLTVVGAAVGTFALGRALGIARFASAAAALTYAFCPFNLYNLELNTGTADYLYPWLFWLFIRAAQKPTVKRSIWAGAGCAALILSGHPESVFFGISFASALMSVLIVIGHSYLSEAQSQLLRLRQELLLIVRNLTVAGLVAFCLSAPVLLPFIEYLRNCDSYKMSIGGSTWIPWQCIFYNLLQPGFGAVSPFIGVIAAVVLPLTFLAARKGNRTIISVICVAALAFYVTTRLYPLSSLLVQKPFNCLITVYCMPVFLLLASLLAAGGMQALVESAASRTRGTLIAVLSAFSVIILVPLVLFTMRIPLNVGDWDLMLPHMSVNIHTWGTQVALLAAALAAYLLSRQWKACPRWLLPIILLAVGFVSIATVARGSLPIQNRFEYPVVEPIPFLQKSSERMVALGDHLFKPNTSAVYGISDIRTHNPLFPARYLEFLKASGARLDMFNQTFNSASSKLLDLASVRYVLSVDPNSATKDLHLLFITPQGIRVYERASYLPRAYLVHKSVMAGSADQALKLIMEPAFSPKLEAVIEDSRNEGLAGSTPGGDSVALHQLGPGSIAIDTNSPDAGLTILTDTYYPGWVAKLDGKVVPILRANYMFRAVETPAGMHHIEFLYVPNSFQAGCLLAAACLVAILTILLVGARHARPGGDAPPLPS